MNILSHKNNRYNNFDFFSKAYSDSDIHGVVLDITRTANGKIVVFENPTNTITEINAIQHSTLSQINSSEIKPLDVYLEGLKDFNKEIMLNVLPLDLPYLTESTVSDIVKINTEYINEIFTILNKFPEISVCLFSSNQILITLIKSKKYSCNLGWLIEQSGDNYIDLEFYVFPCYMLNEKVLIQQLENNKKVMVNVIDSSGIDILMNFFKDISSCPSKKKIFDNIFVITYYPDIFINTYK